MLNVSDRESVKVFPALGNTIMSFASVHAIGVKPITRKASAVKGYIAWIDGHLEQYFLFSEYVSREFHLGSNHNESALSLCLKRQ